MVSPAAAPTPPPSQGAASTTSPLAEERLGIDDVETGADDAEVQRYLEESRSSPWIDNDYSQYLYAMNDQGTAFTAFDVDWSASVTLGSPSADSFLRIYRMDADLDLDRVGDEMVDAGLV